MKNDQILSGIEQMSVLQIIALTEALCKRFGVDPRTLYPQQRHAPVEPVRQVEEAMVFNIQLDSYEPEAKVTVIKLLREVTGRGLVDAKYLAESVPVIIKEGLSKEDADAVCAKFQGIKATVTCVSP